MRFSNRAGTLSIHIALVFAGLGLHAPAQTLDAFLENSTLKIGVNKSSYGGAIVWLSGSDGANLVNNYDKGREIQQSFYAGNSITAANQSSSWSPWAWNPIMVGDYAGHVSPVLAMAKSAGQIYVKTQPLLWDRNNQLSQSYMEQWISLHPTLSNVVAVDCRFTCFRDIGDAWGAPVLRDQELPALYFVSALNTIKAYTGNAPWTTGALATIPNSPSSGTFPWSKYFPTEPWTACVDANGSGVGVYTPIATSFLAGKSGAAVSSNPFNASTMYVSPLGQYAFSADTVFTYRFYLMVGSLSSIRQTVYTLRTEAEVPPPPPTGLAATVGNQQISLTWNPSPNATSYQVKRATSSGGPYTLVASGSATNYTDTGLILGAAYYYVVSSTNSLGEGADSPQVSATATNTIVVSNSGFEAPTIATYQYNPTGVAWTFSNGSGISRNGSAFTSRNPSAPEGVQVAFIQGSGSFVSTTLGGFSPGAGYRLTFSAAQRFGYTGQTWNATIDGSVIGNFAPLASATSYVDYTATFTATSGSSLLKFVGTNLNGGDNTVFIDKVRVVQITAAPTISIVATDASGIKPGTSSNAGSDTGIFTVTRSGLTVGTTTVQLGIGGSAISGTDYALINNTVTFAPGETSKTISVTPLGGVEAVGTRTVVVTVASGTDYTVGSPSSGTVTLADSPYAVWLSGFTFAPGADKTPAGDLDADGNINLVEYALGLDPLRPNASPVYLNWLTVGQNTYLQISVVRSASAPNVLIEGQSTGSLSDPASWSTSTTVIDVNTPTLFQVHDALPRETSKMRFLRLRFTLLP